MTVVCWRGEASGAEWSATPSLSIKGLYNSNLLLTEGDNAVWGNWVTPGVKFKGATEALNVEGETRADFVHYRGDQNREFINLYFPLRTSYRMDRHTFAFEGGLTRDNTLQGELFSTGLVLAFTQRNMWTANPDWKVGITERLSWKSGYHFVDTTYQDGLRVGLVDYQVQGVRTGPTYNLTESDQIDLTGEYTLVRMSEIGLTTSYYGARAGWTHDFGDHLIGSVSAGRRFVDSDQDIAGGVVTSQQTVWLFSASLSKQFERTAMRIDGGRELLPSGFGRVLQTDRVSGSLTHHLTETLAVTLDGSLYFVSGIASTPQSRPVPDSRFFSAGSSISWKVAEEWTMDVGYTYNDRFVDELNQHYNAQSMFLMLRYAGYKWAVSR